VVRTLAACSMILGIIKSDNHEIRDFSYRGGAALFRSLEPRAISQRDFRRETRRRTRLRDHPGAEQNLHRPRIRGIAPFLAAPRPGISGRSRTACSQTAEGREVKVAALIDSSVFIAGERGQVDLADLLASFRGEPLALSAVTASELLFGLHRSRTPAQTGAPQRLRRGDIDADDGAGIRPHRRASPLSSFG